MKTRQMVETRWVIGRFLGRSAWVTVPVDSDPVDSDPVDSGPAAWAKRSGQPVFLGEQPLAVGPAHRARGGDLRPGRRGHSGPQPPVPA